jgi:xanthine/CO dehydrogenase XdhC/CoxF family maturation factor
VPVAELTAFLGWRLTVADHRPAYAAAERFPHGTRVVGCHADELAGHCDFARVDAAVVMSHHLDSDRAYLAALATTDIRYVGLLGPQPRRERLLHELGPAAASLRARLRAPIGLDIGARTPAAIALAIVAEIQAVFSGRAGGRFS